MVQKVFRRQGECNGWCAGGKTIISKLRILQNEVRGVINSDRRLTVREFAEKWEVSKTTVYDILSLTEINRGGVTEVYFDRIVTKVGSTTKIQQNKQKTV